MFLMGTVLAFRGLHLVFLTRFYFTPFKYIHSEFRIILGEKALFFVYIFQKGGKEKPC